jgi:8-oxo-dGTP pyrophosphatase MutT (NUDIX family)
LVVAGAAAPPVTSAAALVALFEEEGEARVVLTRRSSALAQHPGEVSFPGGWVEAGEGVVEAALREAEEEVGLDRSLVEVVGVLGPVTTRSGRAEVTPVVGVLPDGRPQLVANPAEVDAVFDVALSTLLACGRSEWWDTRPMYFFELGEDTVWGMTARVLHGLLSAVTARTRPPAAGPPPGQEGTTPPARA